MQNRKVAFFMPNLAGGGAQRVALILVKEFLKHGLQVDFVLAQAKGEFLKDLPKDINLIELNASRVLNTLPGLVRYLRKHSPVAVYSAPQHTHIILMLAKMISRSSVQVILHVGNHISTQQKASRKFQDKLYPALLWLLQRYASVFIAVSDGVAHDLVRTAQIPPKKVRLVYNPVYQAEMDDLMRQPVIHQWFNEGQLPVILAVGRLVEQKDYPTLIRAFARVRNLRLVRLVILGEGKLLRELKKLTAELNIAGDVDFAGFDPNPYRYMARCSVFVLSSAWEGFANVVAEALACGAQVVSTDCKSGPAEILVNGQYGQLVPVGDEVALADAILQALDHPLPQDALYRRGRFFTAESAARQYLAAAGIHLL